jgi:hypothetical protein
MTAKNEAIEFGMVPIRWRVNVEEATTHPHYFVRKLL